MTSQIRQNFHEKAEEALNKQINMELNASNTYKSMSVYFDRDDIALPGLSQFFKKCSDEEQEHADYLIKYINSRGGRVILEDIKKPAQNEWGNALQALEIALALEKKVNQSLLDLHGIASSNGDPHLSDFLESKLLGEQVESIRKLGVYITKIKRAGTAGLGEYIFDKDLKS